MMKEMGFPRFALKNYQFTLMVFILLVIYGISSYFHMPRTEDPAMTVPGASILVVYPGASPIDLEELIATPLEDAINELDDIKRINTNLRDGIAVIHVEFVFSTDAREKFDEVVRQFNLVKPDLPGEIAYMDIRQWSTTDVKMMQIALVSEETEYRALQKEAERIEKELKKIYGVKKVDILACPEQQVRIAMDLEKMAGMNIPVNRVVQAIQANNANIPGGNIDISGRSFSVKTSGSYTQLDEIRNTIISSYEGRVVYLHQVASVNFDYEDENYYARYNGKRAIFITVEQKAGLNVFDICKQIKKVIEVFQHRLGEEIGILYMYDQSEQVDLRIDEFMKNLFQGILLVGIVIILALGFKSSLIVIIAIPLSIIMGLGSIDVMGYGIQQISIAGLVVALGLLVDNSIVIIENINRFIDMGYPPREAAIRGTSQIGWAIISSTATTVLAFVPVIMMPDKSGEFIKSLPLVIISTLVFSLLIALSLSPLIASLVFKKTVPHNRKQKQKGIKKLMWRFIQGPYRRSLNFALNHKILTLAFALLVLASSVYTFQFLGVSFFPKAEKPQFMIRIEMPEGSNLDKTDQVARHVEMVLDTLSGVISFATNVGHGNPRIYYNVFPKDYDQAYAEILVELHAYEVESFNTLIEKIRQQFKTYPGARIYVKEFEQGPPVEAPVMIYIQGDNLEVLRKIADETELWINEQPGAINCENQLSRRKTDLLVNINRDKAGIYGIPLVEIDRTVRMAVNGITVTGFRDVEGNEYDMVCRLPENGGIKVSDLDKIYLTTITGRQVPLRQIATLEFKEAPTLISRYNLNRTALVSADVRKGYTLDEVMDPVIRKLEEYNFPAGYGYYISGELESRQESFGGMQVAIIIALISIFAVLVLQFKSFSQPLIIYSAIPFAVIGMIWALLITGNTFSFSAFIGLISLVGIVINNSIIMVDYTNQLYLGGKSLGEAIREAGETRFTPIVLTTLTTIGGLLPLTLRGGSMWAPLGWTIIGGLIVSTLLTLIVVPVLYGIFTSSKKLRES